MYYCEYHDNYVSDKGCDDCLREEYEVCKCCKGASREPITKNEMCDECNIVCEDGCVYSV